MKDMTPHTDRSIRNVPVSSGSHRRSAPQERFKDDVPLLKKRRRSRGWLWWGVGVALVCIVAGLLLSTFFEGATVTIYPKTATLTPPANIVASPNAPLGSLGYQTMSLASSATTTGAASGTAHVSKQASGVVVISNSYSTAPQALVVNTRFAAPDGKIYKIHSPVTIPGATKKADGSLTAGTVVATVYADVAGVAYNRTDPTTFTIPGFKGDPRYTKFSAHSDAPITGGFVGDQPAVPPADIQKASVTLGQKLDAQLQGAVASSIPDGFLPVQGSLVITYSDVAVTQGSGSDVSLSQHANASVAIVNSNVLAAILAKLLVQGYAGEAVQFKTPNPLTLSLATTTKNVTGPLTIHLSGSPTLVWQFDKDALEEALLGKDKTEFEGIVETFSPSIVKAQASIRPFWKATFPTDASELTVSVKN